MPPRGDAKVAAVMPASGARSYSTVRLTATPWARQAEQPVNRRPSGKRRRHRRHWSPTTRASAVMAGKSRKRPRTCQMPGIRARHGMLACASAGQAGATNEISRGSCALPRAGADSRQPGMEVFMRRHTVLATFVLAATLAVSSIAPAQPKDQHGTVNFPNSCSPAVQEKFQRAVAMLHSFRYGETEKAFREVLADDPTCAIATWGIATILMSNPLAGVSPLKEWSERGQAALEQGKKIGAKTPREQRYLEAVGAYYEDWPNRPERTRQLNRAKAYQALAERYPEDDEAQIFYALYLAGTQSLADQSYTSYLMAADILEKQ